MSVVLSDYLTAPLHKKERKEIIKETCKQLKASGLKYDAIAFRGMSGCLIAPAVADTLGKWLLMVRKGDDSTHSLEMLEGYVKAKRYIVIDDFTSTGRTLTEMKQALGDRECVGVALYQRSNTIWQQTEIAKQVGDIFGYPVTILLTAPPLEGN